MLKLSRTSWTNFRWGFPHIGTFFHGIFHGCETAFQTCYTLPRFSHSGLSYLGVKLWGIKESESLLLGEHNRWTCIWEGYIPNEIAICHRDNNQQNHWVQWDTLFSDTPIYFWLLSISHISRSIQ